MNERIGRFYLPLEIIESEYASKVFAEIEFVPYKAEYLLSENQVQYVGRSSFFDERSEAEALPDYELSIVDYTDDDFDGKCVDVLVKRL